MIACVSPALTSRSTPRRISRWVPAASSTLTCRSRISRVAMSKVSRYFLQCERGLRERDVDVVALGLHRVDRHRHGGRGAGRLAGPDVEAGPVQPALQGVVVYLALGQRDL